MLNINGINNHWTKTRFWDKEYPNTFRLTTTHKDNEFLSQADHDKLESLKETDPERYLVVGLGEYGIPGGAYFDEFRKEIHICKSFVIPRHWKRFTCMDYGLDMLAHYWGAIDENNNVYLYKELYKSNLVISEAAQEIIRLENEDVLSRYAPPDLWNRRQETGKSAADIFRENGLYLQKTNNKRVQGWYNVKEWLRPIETRDEQTGELKKVSRLRIFDNCVNLIRCLPQLQKSERDPNDVANDPHELTHACLTGDTLVNTPDGDTQIKDLVGKTGTVYCYDENKQEKTISNFFDVRMTNENAEVYEVTFENDITVKATLDHKFLTKDGWKELKNILLHQDEVVFVE